MKVGKVKKGRRSRAEARQEILDRAVEFLWEHPFRDISVARLMTHTSIGRSAFYVYFRDIHQLAEILLGQVREAIEQAIKPWLAGTGEPVPALVTSLQGLVTVCVEHGPIIRAVAEATSTSAELEGLWSEFLGGFDRAVETRVRAEQRAGRIGAMDARAMARALNRLDAAHLIDSFGRHPQPDPDQVAQTLTTIWISTLYGPEKLNNAPLSVMLNEMST